MIRLVPLLACALFACTPNPKTSASQPDASDASFVLAPTIAGQCAQACTNLRSLGCASGFGVDGGQSCEVVCTNAMGTTPPTFDMNLSCLIGAKDKAGVVFCKTAACP